MNCEAEAVGLMSRLPVELALAGFQLDKFMALEEDVVEVLDEETSKNAVF